MGCLGFIAKMFVALFVVAAISIMSFIFILDVIWWIF